MSLDVPPTQQALFLPAPSQPLHLSSTPTPTPNTNELLIRLESTALNPIDWKMQALGLYIQEYPAILGIDGAGVVVGLGEGVEGFEIGDRVLLQGFWTTRQAMFQQYTTVPAEITAKIPPNLTFDQASSIPLALNTAIVGLYQSQFERGGAGLTPFWEQGGRGKYQGKPILIFGGSGSVGQYAIQCAKLSGFSPIITTSSPRNFDLVKSLGATHVLDRTLPVSSIPDAIKEITTKPISIIFDVIASPELQSISQQIISPWSEGINGTKGEGGVITTVRINIPEDQKDPKKKFIMLFGSVHVDHNRELGKSLWAKLEGLLESGDLKPNEVEYVSGGLGEIQEQLERLKKGEGSGKKIVLRPTETV